jgi:hypothetical protein
MVIRFVCKICSYTKRGPPMMIFQLDVVHNSPNKLPQKPMDEKLSPSVVQARVLSFINHKLALAAVRG